MAMKELEYPTYASGGMHKTSWGAIFAGAICSLAVMAALVMLGAGIGFLSAPAADSARGLLAGLGIASAVWLVVSGIVSYYIGGWVTGRLTGIPRVSESVVHGGVAWATATLMFMFMLTSATLGAFGAFSNIVGPALGMQSDRIVQEAGRGDQASGGANQPVTPETGERAAQAAGGVSLLGFIILACNAAACCIGARNGTRVLRPVSMPVGIGESRRETVSSVR